MLFYVYYAMVHLKLPPKQKRRDVLKFNDWLDEQQCDA